MEADRDQLFDEGYLRQLCERMVSEQMASRDISDERVLQAMRSVPRHLFVASEYRSQAYMDCPLPIEEGQTISQPYIVALMTQVLNLTGNETVLEIGTGSGYQAAVLAMLVKQVYSIEIHKELAKKARYVLSILGYANVNVIEGDGSQGLPQYAPYQAIIVTAAAPEAPEPLLHQLASGGRLVIPIGKRWEQTLFLYLKEGREIHSRVITPVIFVPLRGKHGWETQSWSGATEA